MGDVTLRELVEASIRSERELRELKFLEMEKAIREARDVIDRRLEGMNNLRDQIEEERGSMMPLREFERLHAIVVDRISSLENSRSNWEGRIWMLGAGFVILQLGIAIVMHFLK